MTSEVYDLTGAKDFPFPHPVRYPRQLTVEVRPGGVVPPTEYEVIGYGPLATGVTVRWPGAPGGSAEVQLVISRFVEPERVTEFSDDEGVTARALNAEFDNAYRALVDFSATLVNRVDSILDVELPARLEILVPPQVKEEMQPFVDAVSVSAQQAAAEAARAEEDAGRAETALADILALGDLPAAVALAEAAALLAQQSANVASASATAAAVSEAVSAGHEQAAQHAATEAASSAQQAAESAALAAFPTGTTLLFLQPSAPPGWTQDTSINDRVLRVVSSAGGGVGGSWTLSGITIAGTTLSAAQGAVHNHSGTTNSAGAHTHSLPTGGNADPGGRLPSTAIGSTTINSGSSGAHTHTLSISNSSGGGSHTHGVNSNGSWRPAYVDVIACTKD